MSRSGPPGQARKPPFLRLIRRPGLVQQIFFFFIIPLTVLLLLAAFGSQTLHQQAMRSMVGERDQRIAQLAAQAIDAQLAGQAKAISTLAQQLAGGAAPETIVGSPLALAAGFSGGLGVFDRAGTRLAGYGPLADRPPAELGGILAQAQEQALFSRPVGEADPAARWVVTVAATGNGYRVAGAFLPARVIAGALGGALGSSPDIVVSVVNTQHDLLYTSGTCSEVRPCAGHGVLDEALHGGSGLAYLQTATGEHVAAYSPIPSARWAIVIEEHWQMVETTSLLATQYAPIALLVPALLLALAALLFGVRQIVQPLQSLEKRAADLAWGKYETISQPVGGITEIRRLQSELVHLAQKVQAAQNSLHSYIGAITVGQEEERRRLARELHDDTLQSLIALNQRLQAASLANPEPNAVAMLAELQALAGQTIADLRRFTRALRPIYLDELGLVAALEALAHEASQNSGLSVAFHQTGAEVRLAPQVELALYRLAQEALNNVVRHARAGEASLTLAFDIELVTLTIADAGRGFVVPDNPAEFAASGHFGLLGLHERAELIGARLQISSQVGRGTQVVIAVKR